MARRIMPAEWADNQLGDLSLSQKELAHRAVIHGNYISRLEGYQCSATIDMVDSLARILDVEAADPLKA